MPPFSRAPSKLRIYSQKKYLRAGLSIFRVKKTYSVQFARQKTQTIEKKTIQAFLFRFKQMPDQRTRADGPVCVCDYMREEPCLQPALYLHPTLLPTIIISRRRKAAQNYHAEIAPWQETNDIPALLVKRVN